jgi:type I restriction enzyme S subunit
MAPPPPDPPEQRARQQIDARLDAAGWTVQHRSAMNLGAGPGVAVREVRTGAGPADYALFLGNLRRGGGVFGAGKQTTNLASISSSRLKALPVPLPPLRLQERIIAAVETHFSRLDAAVASLTRAKANAKRARASVLKAAVEGRLVPTEAALARAEGRDYEPASTLLARILAERKAAWSASGARGKYREPVAPETNDRVPLPAGWSWATVEQIACEPLCNGRSVPTQADGFPVLRLTAMKRGRINFAEVKNGAWTRDDAGTWLVEGGDFFIMRGNGSLDRVGSAAIAGDPPHDVAFPDTIIRLRPFKDVATSAYLLALWSSHFMRQQIESSARTTAGIYKINQGSIAKYVLPLPPLAEQHRIVAEVDRRLSVLDALDASLDTNLARRARLRQTVLKRAFEGRLVPADDGGGDAAAIGATPPAPA